MKYRSTRDPEANLLNFEDTLFTGLAPDGGLYIPEYVPSLELEEILSWKSLSFSELAFKIFRLFIDQSEMNDNDLKSILKTSFDTFSHVDVTPLKKIKSNLLMLELFWGPTFAFKDVALQCCGNFFEYFLKKKNLNLKPGEKKFEINVVCATSGDTGGAAIYGLRGKENVKCFVLFPKGRISTVQEAQMTSVPDANVFNISIEGTFDTCQEIVKNLFSKKEFKREFNLAAVNSINWCRILSQTVYYFYSFLKIYDSEEKTKIQYSVPTGNFGDILAGFYAKILGLPIYKLLVATNCNNILHKFFETGVYERPSTCLSSFSPAMDILASSNFERLLWYVERGNLKTLSKRELNNEKNCSLKISELMESFKACGKFGIDSDKFELTKELFRSSTTDDKTTLKTIEKYFKEYDYLVDPHTAVGLNALENLNYESEDGVISVCLSTAHPGKFPEAVLKSTGLEFEKFAPKVLVNAMTLEKRCHNIQNGGKSDGLLNEVEEYIRIKNRC
ncbi:threonine synthase [Clydaea vesicula]|uniref:Threonine synthase n=1 Tax=Clydaea vesicula TaxID=447962 RepID=A0AAD5XZY6_9FUNG|nr:threonine synthase [Clydaea vesicula]KAJ3380723.1 threonine synthase [Lobulomyces angularis]